MRVVFRVDASNRMGTGHFMRCHALAEVLRQRGADVRFVCRAHPGHMIEALTREAFPVTVLPAPTESSAEGEDCVAARGVTQAIDATESIVALHGEKPDWLIADHYGLDADWEQELRPHVGNLLVIDDLANRTHVCDVLLDQNCSTDAETRYQGLVPASCRRLLGSRYSLARPEHAAFCKTLPHRRTLADGVSDPQAMNDLSSLGQGLTDGLGAWRVAEYIDPTPAGLLRLRPALPNDVALYFGWVGDAEVRQQSLNSAHISWQPYQEWFRGKLADPHCRLFVLEAGALPVGQVRFDLVDDEARIDYSLDRVIRGRYWSGRLISMGARMLQDSAPIHLHAEVKEANAASCSVFMRLGFEEQSPPPRDARFSICILSDRSSWLNEYIPDLILGWLEAGHRVLWAHTVNDLRAGDFSFYLSCGQVVPPKVLAKFRNNLVVHESDLPQGKGWSPLTWQILEGKNRIPVTLFEAAEKVDSGPIYAQEWLEFEGHELIDELRAAQAGATLNLCRQFVTGYPAVLDTARAHVGNDSFYPRRKPSDSCLDPRRSLAEQFNLLRVVDNERYPAFFEWDGEKYIIGVFRRAAPNKLTQKAS